MWLDINKLSLTLIRPGQQLVKVKYFTSRIKSNKSKIQRQSTYLDALSTLDNVEIYYGQYFINDHTCTKCGQIEQIPTEKMTDVNIATHLLVDAFNNSFDVALLISADTDLTGPVEQILKLFPKKRVILALPPNRTSFQLQEASSAYFRIGRVNFAKSQFAEFVISKNGYQLMRPDSWK
jgi:uncharacterized LabA/DUF88 family protein